MTVPPSEAKLELLISYILIVGVILSVLVESMGIFGYYNANSNLRIIFSPAYALKGPDFFTYSAQSLLGILSGAWTPINLLAFGLVLLMMTPYLRVVASVGYFGIAKNMKYLAITIFVLAVLTASLLLH